MRRDAQDIADEFAGIAHAPVIEHLDLQLVARPIEPRGGGGHTHRKRTFVAHRKLHQDARQGFVGQQRHAHARPLAEQPEVAQHHELKRQRRDDAEHARQQTLQY